MATISTQTFTAANGTNINTLGWTVDEGSITVQSNAANSQTASAFNRARYTTTQLDSINHYAQADVDILGSDNGMVTCRQLGAAHTCYGAGNVVSDNASGLWLCEYTAGSENHFASGQAGAVGAWRPIKLQVNGINPTVCQVWEDGVSRISDSSNSAVDTGQYIGICVWGDGGTWDNFLGADLAGEGLSIPVAMENYKRRRIN